MTTKYTPEQVEEVIRCSTDPIYFIDKYVFTHHPVHGCTLTVPFELYPHQADAIERFVVIGTARQCGTTSMLVAYALWFGIFNSHKSTRILSYNVAMARNVMELLLDMYQLLPDWMRPGIESRDRQSIKFQNGSHIRTSRATENSCKGMTIDLFIWMDMAFSSVREQRECWHSSIPAFHGTRGKCILASSFPLNKKDNLFSEIYYDALSNNSLFKAITFKWWYVPGRTREWKAEQIKVSGKDHWEAEFEITHGEA